MVDPADNVAEAARRVLAGDLSGARVVAAAIDRDALRAEVVAAREKLAEAKKASGWRAQTVQGQAGRNPPEGARYASFRRDQYVCRYCGVKTIDEWVMKILNEFIGDVLPHARHWPADRTHPIMWSRVATAEHVTPWSAGGNHSPENLVCACSNCQYTKNNAPPEQFGMPGPVPESDQRWDGLVAYLAPLANMRASQGEPGFAQKLAERRLRAEPDDLRSGLVISATTPQRQGRRRYQIVEVSNGECTLASARRQPDGTWMRGTARHTVASAALADAEWFPFRDAITITTIEAPSRADQARALPNILDSPNGLGNRVDEETSAASPTGNDRVRALGDLYRTIISETTQVHLVVKRTALATTSTDRVAYAGVAVAAGQRVMHKLRKGVLDLTVPGWTINDLEAAIDSLPDEQHLPPGWTVEQQGSSRIPVLRHKVRPIDPLTTPNADADHIIRTAVSHVVEIDQWLRSGGATLLVPR